MAAKSGDERLMTIAVFMRQTVDCSFSWARMLSSALRSTLLLTSLLTMLGGCGLLGDGATSAFVAPGKYEYYNCDQLAEVGRKTSSREQELVELIARAGQGPGGEFVGAVSYRTDLMQARGDLKQVIAVSQQKNCASQSKWQSDRALW
jgi:hypothetical protein